MKFTENKKGTFFTRKKIIISVIVLCLFISTAAVVVLADSTASTPKSVNTQFPTMSADKQVSAYKFERMKTQEQLYNKVKNQSLSNCRVYLTAAPDCEQYLSTMHNYGNIKVLGYYSNGVSSSNAIASSGNYNVMDMANSGYCLNDSFYATSAYSLPSVKSAGSASIGRYGLLIDDGKSTYDVHHVVSRGLGFSTTRYLFYLHNATGKTCFSIDRTNTRIHIGSEDDNAKCFFMFGQDPVAETSNKNFDYFCKYLDKTDRKYSAFSEQVIRSDAIMFDTQESSVHMLYPNNLSHLNYTHHYLLIYSADKGFCATNVSYDETEKTFYNFYMWVGAQSKITRGISENAYVPSGQTLTVGADEAVYIHSGATLEISQGATLIIKGTLILCGTIENYGNVVIEDGGRLVQSENGNNVGKIYNYGAGYLNKHQEVFPTYAGKIAEAEGSFTVLKNGEWVMAKKETSFYNNGGTLNNAGRIYIPWMDGNNVYSGTDDALFQMDFTQDNGVFVASYGADYIYSHLSGGTLDMDKDQMLYAKTY